MKIYFNSLCVLVLVTIVLTACKTMTDEEQLAIAKRNLANPAKRLTVTVTSEPSGASVFGVKPGIAVLLQDAQPGKYLGKTPLTLTYTRVGRAVFGSLPDETLVIKELDASPISGAEASLKLKCMVIMDGYERFAISEMIEDQSDVSDPIGRAQLKSLDGGVTKVYHAKMVPAKVKHEVLRQVKMGKNKGHLEGMNEAPVSEAKVSFSSTPGSAEVYVDGAYMGNTPSVLPLSQGERRIELKLPGYKPYIRTLKVLAGTEVRVIAVLERLEAEAR